MHFLCKAHYIFYLNLRSVIQNRFSVHAAEDLMLVGNQQLEIQFRCSIQYRCKFCFKTPVGRSKLLRIHISTLRNTESNIIQFMHNAVIEKNVL